MLEEFHLKCRAEATYKPWITRVSHGMYFIQCLWWRYIWRLYLTLPKSPHKFSHGRRKYSCRISWSPTHWWGRWQLKPRNNPNLMPSSALSWRKVTWLGEYSGALADAIRESVVFPYLYPKENRDIGSLGIFLYRSWRAATLSTARLPTLSKLLPPYQYTPGEHPPLVRRWRVNVVVIYARRLICTTTMESLLPWDTTQIG